MGKSRKAQILGPCLFCGGPTDGRHPEHVIPLWMQTDHGLSNKRMGLPNDTTLRFRHAKVPACETHNQIFGRIEARLKDAVASPMEIYLWAFKVHAGLWYLDSRLVHDQRAPQRGSIRTLDLEGEELRKARESRLALFRSVARFHHMSGTFSPSPPGSVFQLPSRSQTFGFVHHPQGFVGVNLPPWFYAVCILDGGAALQCGEYSGLWMQAGRRVPALFRGLMTDVPLPDNEDGLFERLWMAVVAWGVLRQDEVTEVSRDAACWKLSVPPWKPPLRLLFPAFTNLAHGFGVHFAPHGSQLIATARPDVLREWKRRWQGQGVPQLILPSHLLRERARDGGQRP
jgi:hypothetical protein